MRETLLFAAPGTCARVSAIALEEAGLPFEVRVIRFMKGEHKSPDFKAINPKGKVPALHINGSTLTENVAILTYLAELHPEAGLLPKAATSEDRAAQLADLCFCSATLHPLVTRIRMPQLFAGPEHAKAVWSAGCESLQEYFSLIETRLAAQPWWYGDDWSVMDAYLFWVFWRVEGAGFPVKDYPRYCGHASRMTQRPSVQRAMQREEDMSRQLDAEGLLFTPPPVHGAPQ